MEVSLWLQADVPIWQQGGKGPVLGIFLVRMLAWALSADSRKNPVSPGTEVMLKKGSGESFIKKLKF